MPRDLVQSCKHYRREMRGVHVPRDIYVSVAGTDLVRLEDSRFVVLEDNLRVPSGVSYMLANREVTKRVLPGLFDRHHIRPIAQRQVDEILDDDPHTYLDGIGRYAAEIHAAVYKSYIMYPVESALPA